MLKDMKSSKHLKPGQDGTKRLVEQYKLQATGGTRRRSSGWSGTARSEVQSWKNGLWQVEIPAGMGSLYR